MAQREHVQGVGSNHWGDDTIALAYLRDRLPDFIVEMIDGRRLIIEIKGADQNRDADIKAAAAERWCAAVNNDGRFGPRTYHLVRDPAAIGAILR